MSDAGFLPNHRPIHTPSFLNEDAAAYTDAKATAVVKSDRLTASDRSIVSRILRALADEFRAGLHVGGVA